MRIYGILEKHYRDMQDIEFTIERGKLWMLQTRTGKRTGQGGAAASPSSWRSEGLITQEEAVAPRRAGSARPAAASDDRSRRPSARSSRPACRPRPARRRGEIVFNADEAESAKKAGRKVILVRIET